MVKTISYSDKNNSVKVAKYLTGFSLAGKATNVYDKAFKKHVIAWKTAHGLTNSDIIGPLTWAKIAETAPTVASGKKAAINAFRLAMNLGDGTLYTKLVQDLVKRVQEAAGLTVDGECGPKTWVYILQEAKPRNKQTVDLRQNGQPYSDIPYNNVGKPNGQTIGTSGCGPTSMASVICTLVDEDDRRKVMATLLDPNESSYYDDVNPVSMCALAVKWKMRLNSGTNPKFFAKCADTFGLRCVSIDVDNDNGPLTMFKHCLDMGGIVICRFKKGWWTNTGHYSPCYMYNSSYFFVDNTYVTIGKGKWKRAMSKLKSDCRNFYCIYPK